jgi:hypothetical protein
VFTVWLLGDHLLLRDFGPYGIIFMNVCVVITVAMVILLQDFGPYVVNIYDCVFTTLNFSVIHGQLPSYFLILFYRRVQGFTERFSHQNSNLNVFVSHSEAPRPVHCSVMCSLS